ncbi:hypothetical protein AAHC03_020667 [Spirometra sp. Aus1]
MALTALSHSLFQYRTLQDKVKIIGDRQETSPAPGLYGLEGLRRTLNMPHLSDQVPKRLLREGQSPSHFPSLLAVSAVLRQHAIPVKRRISPSALPSDKHSMHTNYIFDSSNSIKAEHFQRRRLMHNRLRRVQNDWLTRKPERIQG